MSALKLRLQDDMKAALRAGDKARLGVLRLMLAAIRQREIDERIELTDDHVIAVLDRMVKQRRESIAHYLTAQRSDLVDAEAAEVAIIREYLPQALTEAELDALVRKVIATTQAKTLADLGRVMTELKTQLQGRADLGAVSTRVRQLLSV